MIALQREIRVLTFSFVFAACTGPSLAQDSSAEQQAAAIAVETPFLRENDDAMAKMMTGMAAKPTGDINRDFTEMMIPHHQGAIDMAQAYLRYGSNEQLKRIAQEIIVDQLQEIAAMRFALGDALPASSPAPTQAGGHVDMPAGAAHSQRPSALMMMMMKPGK